jgi:hypothetical protein
MSTGRLLLRAREMSAVGGQIWRLGDLPQLRGCGMGSQHLREQISLLTAAGDEVRHGGMGEQGGRRR